MKGLLLDTHIVLNRVMRPGRLSREQLRVIDQAENRGEHLGVSAATLLEIVILMELGQLRNLLSLTEILATLEQPPFVIFPLSAAVALEVSALPRLKDPFDRAIAATARVHGLRLVTSDQRIIESNVVSTIE